MLERNQTDRGFEISNDMSNADMNHELIRCIAEYIANLERRLDNIDKSPQLGISQQKYYIE